MHADDQDATGPRPAPGPRATPATAAPPTPGPVDPPEGSTGDAAVDAALGRLAELDGLSVREHVAVFEAVHAALQDRLADVED